MRYIKKCCLIFKAMHNVFFVSISIFFFLKYLCSMSFFVCNSQSIWSKFFYNKALIHEQQFTVHVNEGAGRLKCAAKPFATYALLSSFLCTSVPYSMFSPGYLFSHE